MTQIRLTNVVVGGGAEAVLAQFEICMDLKFKILCNVALEMSNLPERRQVETNG